MFIRLVSANLDNGSTTKALLVGSAFHTIHEKRSRWSIDFFMSCRDVLQPAVATVASEYNNAAGVEVFGESI